MPSPQQELQRAHAALSGGQPTAAVRVCQKLLTDNPRNVDARYLHGRSLAALGRWREAAGEFRRVLSNRGNFFPAMVDLGIADALDGNYQDARAVLERARAIDQRPAEVHFGMGLCLLGCNDPTGAAGAFQSAIHRNPHFPDAHNNLGVAYDRQGRLAEAVACFRKAASLHASHADAHRNLGDALFRHGDLPGAIAAFRRAADLQPQDGSAHAELGTALQAAGEFAAAAQSLERALGFDTTLAAAAVNLGAVYSRLGQPERAAGAYQHAARIDPQGAEARLGLGALAAAAGDVAGAAHHYAQAAAARPWDPAIALTAAASLEDLGVPAQALELLETAVGALPANADLHDALGRALHGCGRLAEALDRYERALELDAERPQTLLNCGRALESMGALGRAITCLEQALRLRAAHAPSMASIASCAYRLCDWDRVDDMLSALRGLPDGIDELQAFLLLATDLKPGDVAASLQRRAQRSAARIEPCVPAALLKEPGEPLRVAYISPDFRAHPVAFALAGVVEHHDRARVAPIGISLMPGDGSDIASRLQGAFDEFIEAESLSDQAVASLIRERSIDIAIDLAGLTTGARSGIFSLRAAPVQINYLGFPGSTGMPFMDFIIADRIVVPRLDELYFEEKVLRLPHCYLPFDDRRSAGAAGIDRQAAGLPAAGFVFCAFNTGFKITRTVFDVWMRLLHQVPGSVLWLRSMGPATAANLKDAAVARGIGAERLIFAKFEARIDAHLARLQLADLYLDTLPYNAHTTAAEALWCGVPVVTCTGTAFAGRVGASLLSSCDLADLICGDLDAYEALALAIARSPSMRTELRRRVRRAHSLAPVFDTQRYTRDLEDLLVEAHGIRALHMAAGPALEH